MNCDNASLLLYAVTDRSWLHGQTLYEQAEQALQGGATFLQLREKELDEAHFQEEAIALKALCKQYGVPFVLDDNVALAVATDATACTSARATWRPARCARSSARTRSSACRPKRWKKRCWPSARARRYLGVGACSDRTKPSAQRREL